MSDMLDKVAKLLKLAENAATEEEADAAIQAAQRLSTTHSISLAEARRHIAKGEKREQPERRTVDVESYGKNAKKHMVELYDAIGRNNDIKIDISHNSNRVFPYGFPSDLEVVEAMFASLAIQMVDAANAYIKSGEYKSETYGKLDTRTYTWVEKPIDGRVARSNFYSAFTSRISSRLSAARREAEAEIIDAEDPETTTGTELVLLEKREEVNDFYKSKSNARGSWGGPSSGAYSASASNAGSAAASRASLREQQSFGPGRKGISA